MLSLFIEQVVDRIGSKEKVASNGIIKLTIDYTKTIEQAITDGNYGWKSNKITTNNFPIFSENIGGKVEVSGKLFCFKHDQYLEEIISEMNQDGYRPADIMELVVLGSLFPKLVKKHDILALGSSMKHSSSSCFFPCLNSHYADRSLDLEFRFLDRRWIAGQFPNHFLGILKN